MAHRRTTQSETGVRTRPNGNDLSSNLRRARAYANTYEPPKTAAAHANMTGAIVRPDTGIGLRLMEPSLPE